MEITHTQRLIVNLLGIIFWTPIAGYIALKIIDFSKKAWKAEKRVKMWVSLCIAFFLLSILTGGLVRGLH